MTITATVNNAQGRHEASVSTQGQSKTVSIPAKSSGLGSSVNGGELLFLALATCFCNDLYREAPRRGIEIEAVEVTVVGEFGVEGEPAKSITYQAAVIAPNSTDAEIEALIRHVDTVAEIHNTLRQGVAVVLKG